MPTTLKPLALNETLQSQVSKLNDIGTVLSNNLFGKPLLQAKTITENGVYSADSGYDGIGDVTVNVASEVNNEDKTITENGTYSASTGYTGLGTVVVNVSGGGGSSGSIELQSGYTYTLDLATMNLKDSTMGDPTANDGILSMTLPLVTTVSSEGSMSYYNCHTLNLPDCTSLGYHAFYNNRMPNLVTLRIPKCTSIEGNALGNCSILQHVYLDNVSSVTSVDFTSFGTVLPMSPITIHVPSSLYTEFIANVDWANLSMAGYITLVAD